MVVVRDSGNGEWGAGYPMGTEFLFCKVKSFRAGSFNNVKILTTSELFT